MDLADFTKSLSPKGVILHKVVDYNINHSPLDKCIQMIFQGNMELDQASHQAHTNKLFHYHISFILVFS